jgi:hypothetical protein
VSGRPTVTLRGARLAALEALLDGEAMLLALTRAGHRKATLDALAAAGLVRKRRGRVDWYYALTAEGRDALACARGAAEKGGG